MTCLKSQGYALVSGALTEEKVGRLLGEWEELQQLHTQDPAVLSSDGVGAFAARNLLRIWPKVAEALSESIILRSLVIELGTNAGIVRALFFDKPPGNSWALPWHKDYMIAVKAHGTEGIFTNPGITAGVPQVKAPKELLERMLTVRVHLDDMTDDNGPLRVLPGSHEQYLMSDDDAVGPVTINCKAGDVLLMRPLLTHASGRSKPGTAAHRRILHLECAPTVELPDGYEWHDFVAI
jgi:ectoine hydroxylase-related dioxygenase (phytanoyl-CoA dioxygenase family)